LRALFRAFEGEDALEDDGPQLFVLRVERYCEAFHCTPVVAIRDLNETPSGLIDRIFEARAFEACYRRKDEDKERRPTGRWMELVDEIEAEAAQAEFDSRK